ncbi:MAG: polyphosphate kinase 2 family protein [Acidimicrobiia bacterium]
MDEMVDAMRVKPGVAAGLASRNARDKLGLEDKAEAAARRDGLGEELEELHELLWAEGKRSVLLVLQGMDTAGKDGTIRRVLSGLNPQGCRVASFKAPTETERAQDYLWRVHAECPPRGMLGVFNRSHYEDVLAARMIGVVDRDRCRQRYRHLREFERMLTEEGTTVVKVFLHISKDEQRVRLQERVDDPVKNWKFKAADLDVRKQWDEYQDLYEEVITETSTGEAPWYVVPADRKWVRDVAVETLLVETLTAIDPRIPPADPSLERTVVE